MLRPECNGSRVAAHAVRRGVSLSTHVLRTRTWHARARHLRRCVWYAAWRVWGGLPSPPLPSKRGSKGVEGSRLPLQASSP